MMNRFIESHWTKIVAIFLMAMFAYIAVVAETLWRSPDGWLIGDWLINYEGGLVRRGLPGETLLKVASFAKIDLITLIILTQLSLCLCTFVFTFKLAKSIKLTVVNALIIFSPAFIQFLAMGLGGFRKEMLLFFLLSVHSYYLSRNKGVVKNSYLVVLSLIFVVAVLSHEMLLVFLPYFVCGLYLQNKPFNRETLLKYTALLVPATLAAIAVVVFFRGNEQVIQGICASLVQVAPYDCQAVRPMIDGHPVYAAIGFLALNFHHGMQVVANGNPPIGLLTNGVVLVLAMAPLLYVFKKYEILKEKPYLLLFVLLSLLATLPLMFVVADYGRLISIHATCLSYVALQILNSREEPQVKSQATSIYAWILCLVFIVGWRVIAYGALPKDVFPALQIYKEMRGGDYALPQSSRLEKSAGQRLVSLPSGMS